MRRIGLHYVFKPFAIAGVFSIVKYPTEYYFIINSICIGTDLLWRFSMKQNLALKMLLSNMQTGLS